MVASVGKQLNVVSNTAIHTIFFEAHNIAYNYRTGRWTKQPAFNESDISYLDIDDDNITCGLLRKSGTAYDIQDTNSGLVPQDALLETGETDPNQQGRFVTTGVTPLINESTLTSVKVRIGYRDTISATINYTATATPSTVTGIAPFRQDARYHRAEVEIEGGFDTALGIDVQGYPQGNR